MENVKTNTIRESCEQHTYLIKGNSPWVVSFQNMEVCQSEQQSISVSRCQF